MEWNAINNSGLLTSAMKIKLHYGREHLLCFLSHTHTFFVKLTVLNKCAVKRISQSNNHFKMN